MKNSKQREWLAKTIEEAKAIGVQVRWHSKTIVVLGTTDDGDKCEKDHQPLHGETRQEGRSEDRPHEGPRLGEDERSREKEVEESEGR